MEHDPLNSYLEAHRRRTGLSQRELGFLLGGMSGRTVRRHERGREANMRSVLAYEFLLGASAGRLFKGPYTRVRTEMAPRIRGLIASLRRQKETKLRNKRIEHLERLLDGDRIAPAA
jgi:hypothetical protein